jgi:RNA polymerase sigma-70 factor (ECF subfamily)
MPSDTIYNEPSILQEVAAGSEPAFRQLYDRYHNKIYTIAWRITGMESAAEDTVQDVFIKLWENRGKLPSLGNFSGWLNTITRHHIYNNLRKLAHEEQFLRHLLAQKPAASDTMESLAFHELKNLLNKAVNELTPQQKKVYLLSRTEGLSHAAIAEVMGLSPETVKSYMKDALRSIREFINRNERLFLLLVTMLLSACRI